MYFIIIIITGLTFIFILRKLDNLSKLLKEIAEKCDVEIAKEITKPKEKGFIIDAPTPDQEEINKLLDDSNQTKIDEET